MLYFFLKQSIYSTLFVSYPILYVFINQHIKVYNTPFYTKPQNYNKLWKKPNTYNKKIKLLKTC